MFDIFQNIHILFQYGVLVFSGYGVLILFPLWSFGECRHRYAVSSLMDAAYWLSEQYRPNAPLVLKGITCTFKEGTRVGIIGRTWSGKTTLITTLFRLVEPDSGKILIDRLNICSIGLKDLRMKISVIPQEPILFRGSIQTNLDPLKLHSDDEIWMALKKCQLKSMIRSLPNLLDSSVSDEGENWSAGQRQLFCLVRVLLRRNKYLELDEATASIDSATYAILQKNHKGRVLELHCYNCHS
ncbi:ABC transporter C family member 8-like protein isoform X1 [Tanacetum coccineum]|uniref:ABC transporter C family member 8-like protein isoform X1 n=1 Tax=Tanacetum coccineum TaxID=301880 RepID=A0ABQ5CD82_9ASTR